MPDHLLISGPPASGKSTLAINRFLAIPQSVLLTPTSTMAEHVRNELARAGAAVRPSRVATLAHFLEAQLDGSPTDKRPDAVRSPAGVPAALLHLLIGQALERPGAKGFAAVAEFRGFRQSLATLFEELSANNPSAVSKQHIGEFRGAPIKNDLLGVFRDVEVELTRRGFALRGARLRAAAAKIRTEGALPWKQVILDGFFTLSPAELELVEGLSRIASLAVTLPDWPDSATARARLLALGFAEQRLGESLRRSARYEAFSAATLEQETEEVARRILAEAAQGRAFREMGILLRVRDPYGPALEATLARFGIPARFYFTDPLAKHPVVQYLGGILDAMLQGWDHAAILSLLRMPVSGVGATPAGDAFDFALRLRLPGAGLASLPLASLRNPSTEDLPAGVPEFAGLPLLDSLAALDPWRRERLDPSQWATRLKTLPALLPSPEVGDRAEYQQVGIWRSTAAAEAAFCAAMDQTAAALNGSGALPLAQFWSQARVTLSLEPLRAADRRRDVVHVMDVFEARQWELPIVFVCGLTERHFPQYHYQDPLLSDSVRRSAGLRTSSDRQRGERFLFEFAVSRATERTVLSYPRFNDKGEKALPSFFLADLVEAQSIAITESVGRIRPRPQRASSTQNISAVISIETAELRKRLVEAHRTLSPTSIESFLQCPFQFFSSKTLRLRPRPAAPRDRLDLLVQGSILHAALAELARSPVLGAAVFDAVFDQEIQRARILRNYRTEAVRLEMLRHFEGFLADQQFSLGWTSRIEESFAFPLNAGLSIRGRIDRLEIGPAQQALVIDYKYSAGNKIRERVEESDAGNLVQGGLYLLAAERQFHLKPAGMLYCGLRKDITWEGWHAAIPGLEGIGESTTPAALRELMDVAAQTAVRTYEAVVLGEISVQPADRDKCRWCDFRDICRDEPAAGVVVIGESAGDSGTAGGGAG